MSDGSPVEQLAAEGVITNESELKPEDRDAINSLTAEEVTALISARAKIHFKPLEKMLGFPF
jgi:hypothetical protein